MADEKKNPLGPTGERVRQNLKRIREGKRLTYVELSDLLSKTGRPIPVLGLRRIERGERRVDADDLAALSVVLNVGVAALLLPPEASQEQIELTKGCSVSSRTAWRWAEAQGPAVDWEPGEGVSLAEPGADPAIAAEAYEREQEYGRKRAEYMALTLPPELRRAADHPLVRLAEQLEELVEDIVGPWGDRDGRARWSRMALRRVEQLRLNLEEVAEAMTGEDALEQFKRQHPGVVSHTRGDTAGADGNVGSVDDDKDKPGGK